MAGKRFLPSWGGILVQAVLEARLFLGALPGTRSPVRVILLAALALVLQVNLLSR